eukprot:scpid83568/ scgid0738/ Ras-related protein Rab-13
MSTAESVAQYTVVLCGDSTVGKTSLWCALQHLPIPESPSNTPVAGEPVECEYRVCLSTGDWITLKVVDTGGAEKYQTFTLHRYRYGSCVVFVYAINNETSFTDIPKWVRESHRAGFLESGFASFLIGNKTDVDERSVFQSSQHALARQMQLTDSFETSAKYQPDQVRAVFDTIADMLHSRSKAVLGT